MLCLKACGLQQPATRTVSLNDLPQELFGFIIGQCVGYLPVTLALSSVSFVSKRFRHAAIAILFRSITITLPISQRRQKGTVLGFLLANPHIRRCIRKVRFCTAAGEHARQEDENAKLRQVLPLLDGLRDVEFASFDEDAWEVLGLVSSLENPPRIAINDFFLDNCSKSPPADVVKTLQSSSTIQSLNCRPVRQIGPGFQYDISRLQYVWYTVSLFSHLQSLTLTFLPPGRYVGTYWIPALHSWVCDGICRHRLPPIRKLHVDGWLRLPADDSSDPLSVLEAFQWRNIEKLTLSGAIIQVVLPRFGEDLVSLRCLCLREAQWSDAKSVLPVMSTFLATTPLVELELDGFSNDLSVEVIAKAPLRKLRLHTWETAFEDGPSCLRSAKDVRRCAELAPNLECLMLDVAHIGKLWHPTAIPGVDVDVQVYQILDALSKFRRLKILHLFPRLFSSNGSYAGQWKQAMEDEAQAVRIFRHVKCVQPHLELLIISSDTMVAQCGLIDPMSWMVCPMGEYILVRVSQANKDYEQRQIWQGQRRLRTETKRYPYLDLCNLYLSGVEPPFSHRRLS